MSTRSSAYLTALMQCLLSRLLLMETPNGSRVKRLSKEPIASLSFEALKLEVENARSQLVATDSRPVTAKVQTAQVEEDLPYLMQIFTKPGASDSESV